MSQVIENHEHPPIQLYFNSSKANIINSRGNLVYYLHNPISAGHDSIIYCNVLQITIPNTCYGITEDINDLLYVKFNNITHTYQIPYGNYTTDTLTTALDTLMSGDGFTITFSSLTNQFTFTHDTYAFEFMYEANAYSTALDVLGFEAATAVDSGVLLYLSSTSVVNLAGNTGFYVTCQNFSTNNVNFVNDTVGRNCNVLAKVPFSSESIQGGIEYYYNYSGFKSRLNCNKIDSFHFVLYQDDLDTEFVPLKDWSMVIELTFAHNPANNYMKA